MSGRAAVFVAAAASVVLLNARHDASAIRRQSDLRFDVASIKPNDSDNPGAAGLLPHAQGNRFLAGNTSLAYLIKGAYELHEYQLQGEPKWINDDRFDIEAKTDLPDRLDREQMLSMLRHLLEDRFQLKMHKEVKQLPVFELVINKGRSKLHSFTSATESPAGFRPLTFLIPPGYFGPPPPPTAGIPAERVARIGAGVIIDPAMSITTLAELLSAQTDRRVIDKTRLRGRFQIDLSWLPEGHGLFAPGIGPRNSKPITGQQTDDPRPSIFTALQEQLGLKLQPSKGPVEVMVIDSVQKPTGN